MKEMLLTKTTGIEVGILLAYLFIALFWHLLFLLLLFFIAYMAYHFYKKTRKKMCLEEQTMAGFVYSHSGDDFMQFNPRCRVPRIEDNEVFVKVYAASINPVDYKVCTSRLPLYRWLSYDHHGIGKDFSGKVLHVGEKVTKLKPGDDVFGYSRDGALQEYTSCLDTDVVIKPPNISFNQAASLTLAGMTSYQSLNWFFPIQGKKVLIIGGSGGTGHFGIQIAKYLNASQIYGVCSSQKAEFVKSLGADQVVCYDETSYLSQLNNEKFDLIYDTVTSPEDTNQEPIYSPYLDFEGKYVAINGPRWNFVTGGFNSQVTRCECLERKNYHLHLLKWNQTDMGLLAKMAEEGRLVPNIAVSSFNEGNVKAAYAGLKSRKVKGKLVIEISKPETYY